MNACACKVNKVGNQGGVNGGGIGGLYPITYFVAPRPLGENFYAGFYHALPTAALLTQASQTVIHGSANEAAGSRIFIVSGGPGSTDAGTASLVASGNSIDESGVRVVGDSEVIVADVTVLALNQYVQSSKKWIGQVTLTLTGAGGASVFNADVNYGHARFEDAGDVDFVLEQLNIIGLAGGNDAGIDVELLHHKTTGWIYSAAAFVPGNGVIASLATDYGADNLLVNGENFSWARKGLDTTILGSQGEGFIYRITTQNNNTINSATINTWVREV